MDSCSESGDSTAERMNADLRRMAVLARLKKRLELQRTAYEHPIMAKNPKTQDKRHVDNGIVEHIQGVGTPTRSWLATSIEQAITHGGQRVLSSREGTNTTPKTQGNHNTGTLTESPKQVREKRPTHQDPNAYASRESNDHAKRMPSPGLLSR